MTHLPASVAGRAHRGGDGAVGPHDLLAAHVLRDALVAAADGNDEALAWLRDQSRPFGGRYWAETLGAGEQIADVVDRL